VAVAVADDDQRQLAERRDVRADLERVLVVEVAADRS
jgi:hypothetical protein